MKNLKIPKKNKVPVKACLPADQIYQDLSERTEKARESWQGVFNKYRILRENRPDCTIKSLKFTNSITESSERVSRDFLFVGKVPKQGSKNYKENLVTYVEGILKSNLKEFAHKREIAKIFFDEAMYKRAHEQTKEEIKRIKPRLGSDNVRQYLFIVNKVEKNDEIWNLIENVFQSNLKTLLTEQQNSKSVDEFKYRNGKLQREWDGLAAIMDTSDILIYACYHIISLKSD